MIHKIVSMNTIESVDVYCEYVFVNVFENKRILNLPCAQSCNKIVKLEVNIIVEFSFFSVRLSKYW